MPTKILRQIFESRISVINGSFQLVQMLKTLIDVPNALIKRDGGQFFSSY